MKAILVKNEVYVNTKVTKTYRKGRKRSCFFLRNYMKNWCKYKGNHEIFKIFIYICEKVETER